MGLIDVYGDFDVPEEKLTIEIVEDPVKTVLSCHDFAKKNSIKKTKYNGNSCVKETVNTAYAQLVDLFKNHKNLKPDMKKILPVLKTKAEECDITGLFLSALHNTVDLDALIVDDFPEELDHLGFLLKEDKILVLGKKIKCNDTGEESCGKIINHGNCQILGFRTNNGLIINNSAINYALSFHSTKGIYINNGHTDNLNVGSSGIHINLGTVRTTGFSSTEGININKGETWMIDGGLSINFKGKITKTTANLNPGGFPAHKRIDKNVIYLDELNEQHLLETKLKEIDDLLAKIPKEIDEENIKFLNKFDCDKYEEDMTKICRKIKGEYKFSEGNDYINYGFSPW